jgi:4a-hydroxytetrahydrobiopterin dehydratase
MTILDDPDLSLALAGLGPGWRHERGALRRGWRFADFAGALAFVNALGALAEEANHHPDLELGWGRVAVAWTTHDAGGVTRRDVELASACDALAARLGIVAAP